MKKLFYALTAVTVAGSMIAAIPVSAASNNVKGSTFYTGEDAQQKVNEMGLQLAPNEEVVSFSVRPVQQSYSALALVAPEWGSGYYMTNKYKSGYCSLQQIGLAAVKAGPGTISLSVQEGIQATWSTSVGVDAEFVSANVGFSVTSSFSVTQTATDTVPAGETYRMTAYPEYSGYTFDIWYDPYVGSDYYAGYGSAYKPVAVCFVTTSI